MQTRPLTTDILIAGGGLAGGLVALALAARRPDLTVSLIDAQSQLGGNHIWSFFDSDLAAEDRPLVAPLVCHHWPDHEVRFGAQSRTLPQAYNAIESERFDQVVRGRLAPDSVLTGTIVALDGSGATLADGRRVSAAGVVDARGGTKSGALDLGWQKFLGRLLRLARPHGLVRPTIMDATVNQEDGYRFVYLLPFAPDLVFVEDTYYSTSPALDRPELVSRIDAYARERGWAVVAVEREEAAALPIAMGGDFPRLWEEGGTGVPKIGMAAGLFQPMTGYSLPDAVRTASLIARLPDLTSPALARSLRAYAESCWRERGFYRLLARLLFRAAEPAERWRVLARFYRLDPKLIARFYAGNSSTLDKVRILAGKPPVPLGRAMSALRERMP